MEPLRSADGPARTLLTALYAAAFLVIFDQLAELAVSLYPFRIGDVQWRFGAFGVATGRATILVLVDALILIAALGRGHFGFLRIWGLLHLVVAAGLLTSLALFGLDTVELFRSVRPEGRRAFVLAALRAGLMVTLMSVFCIWLAVLGWRASKRQRSRPAPQPTLIVRSGGS